MSSPPPIPSTTVEKSTHRGCGLKAWRLIIRNLAFDSNEQELRQLAEPHGHGKASTAFGEPSSTLGKASTAFGEPTSTLGKASTAFGEPTSTLGKASTAVDKPSSTLGRASTAY